MPNYLSHELITQAEAVADPHAASLMLQAAERLEAARAQLAAFLEVYGDEDAASAEIADVLSRLGASSAAQARIEELCEAAGFAGPVEPEVMRARVEELHATAAGYRQLILDHQRRRTALTEQLNSEPRYHLVADLSLNVAARLADWCRRAAQPIRFTTLERATHTLIIVDELGLVEAGLKRIPDGLPVAIWHAGQVRVFPTVRVARETLSPVGVLCPASA